MLAGAVGLGLVGASYATLSVNRDQEEKLRSTLNPELTDTYKKIVQERRDHYLQGITLGTAIAYFSAKALNTSNIYHRVMTFIAVTLVVAIMYYSIMPKSDYMIRHLKTEE